MNRQWTVGDIGDQSGRIAVVTGANSGLGYETAKVLAARGAYVVLAVRDTGKGELAAASIAEAHPHAELGIQEIDLAALDSVTKAAQALTDAHPHIDLLINNAGVMFTPRATTRDGFELQFGVNHLGPFALTGQLLGSLLAVPNSRVVTISSQAHRVRSALDVDDLDVGENYSTVPAYGRSKLANLLFTYELDRRLRSAGHRTVAVAAHPGWAATNLTRHVPRSLARLTRPVEKAMFQSAAMGALPALRAATDPEVTGGRYYGPGGFLGHRGLPVAVESSRRSRDGALARRLWHVSQEMTGITYAL